MKINGKNGVITKTIHYCVGIDEACKELKEIIEDNYHNSMFIILENESEYNFMKLFMDVGLYYHYDMAILDIIGDALLTYEVNNYMALYIHNEEMHDKISNLMRELEKLARTRDMWSDLKHSSIYRMLYDAQWRYENTIEDDDYMIEEDGEEED